ncbi:MAG: ATP-binding protein [Gammaproteobacteria bacterium]|nr:ATP-binding protein [Gammaproteobacteria bacterium]
MHDFEKLGAFYLGKRYDTDAEKLTEELVLYDSKDLTTHAVIIGMTGSGKTGLGIGILEEAALDHIPVIAIDPKGDMGNLLLTFPKLEATDFRPWINPRTATDKGQTPDEFAASQAALWKKGLGQWGQTGKRITALRKNVDLAIYTPGSNSGVPVSVLQSFSAPDEALIDDIDLYRERVQSTATGILTLLDIDADPVASREHILISQLLDKAWREGRSLDVAGLIGEIQDPPITKVGVMNLDSFFPAKDRFDLAMRLNNLLAAPGFEAWMEGTPLDAKSLLYTEEGKPRISIMSIAHLDDAQRMFFVSMLLNELIAWMRAQQGTSSLRAILYMDEIFGYMPPVANPPSKKLFLTLLKQARAYGLGLVLATQNPVDLDYKGLSNTGTWFIGRLQTERDKARVMEGLEGASGGDFDKQAMERTIAGLGKRRFLLHNVHEDAAVVFNTRWVMSYLAGPLTRDHIRTLMSKAKTKIAAAAKAVSKPKRKSLDSAPALPPSIEQYFVKGRGDEIVYHPRLIGAGDVVFTSARYNIEDERSVLHAVEFEDGPVEIDWDNSERLDLSVDDLLDEGAEGASYADCPAAANVAKNYSAWGKDYKRWLRQNENVILYKSKRFRLTSSAGETEGEFRVRLQDAASELRDRAIAKIRKRYASKVTTLENRLLRAEQAIAREKQQSTKKKLDTAISFGTAILGAVLGRKKLSSSTATKIGSAIKTAGGAGKEAADVGRAIQTAEKVKQEIAALNKALEKEVAELDTSFDAQTEELDEIVVRAKSTDIHVSLTGLVWLPYTADDKGRFRPVW